MPAIKSVLDVLRLRKEGGGQREGWADALVGLHVARRGVVEHALLPCLASPISLP